MSTEIRIENVSKAFEGQAVLRDFSAVLPLGRAAALMGPSGSGKTTLARLIIGLDAPDAGHVVGAENLRFACVFQEDRLCEDFSAMANVALVLPRHRKADAAAALAGLGLSGSEMRKRAAALSGGEKRRVALVRAVEAESDVLVLDEAFKGLDDAMREVAYEYVRKNLRERTLLVITHDAAEAAAFGAQAVAVQKLGQKMPDAAQA